MLDTLSFSLNSTATLIVIGASILFYFLWQRRKLFPEPHLFFSDGQALKEETTRTFWGKLPQNLMWAALASFVLAFIDPHFNIDLMRDKQTPNQVNPARIPTEGLGIYLVLDQSGSMKEEVRTAEGRMSKVNLLKEVTRDFIAGNPKLNLQGRPNDMIGLVAFARAARVLSPLTLDHAAVLEELTTFAPVKEMDNDGTSIGYAIFKTANMIAATKHYAEELKAKGEPAYTIKQTIIILITDGLQDPNPLDKGKRLRNMDVPEAAQYAKDQGIRLYIVNVEPKLATEEFAPYRHIMQRAAELTGGKFFMVDSTANLGAIYQDIDKLEKSVLPTESVPHIRKEDRPDLYQKVPLYPYLVAFGLFALFLSLALDLTLLRRIP